MDEASVSELCNDWLARGCVWIALRPTSWGTKSSRTLYSSQTRLIASGIGRAWQARTSIYHLQNFTSSALRLVMDRHGFEVVRLDCINELSWPIDYYVQVYLIEKYGVPKFLKLPIAFLLKPLLRSRVNSNKAVLVARLRAQ